MRFAAAAAAFALLAFAAPAQAIVPSVLKSAESCPALEHHRAFSQFLDPLLYALVPGGSFETGAPGWTMQGASIAPENEPFHVGGDADAHSLSLPPRSSATSASFCARSDMPTLRFFAYTTGARAAVLTSKLRVEAMTRTAGGRVIAVPLGSVAPAPSWRPTRPLAIVVNTLSVGDGTPLAFRFRPAGAATWLIDDVYVDPFRRS